MNIMLMPKIEVVRAKAKEHEEKARKYAAEAESRRKKSKRRDSARRRAVALDGGKGLAGKVEIPDEVREKTGDEAPRKVENTDAQAENSQGTEKEN